MWPTNTILRSGFTALHVSGGTQAFERIFPLVIHEPAGTLGRARHLELGDDLFEGPGGAFDRHRNVLFSERPVTFTISRQVKGNERNVLSLVVAPDVDFGPMQQRMNSD